VSFFLNKNTKRNATKRYQPSLVSLMTLCANNYMLLLKVLANTNKVNESRNFFISDKLAYTVKITEVTRYTSVIVISQTSNDLSHPTLTKLLQPSMMVRLYHDARVAEVLSSQGIKRIQPRYDYPNKQMHQQDEKEQTNQFLNEWLHLCLELGQVDVALQYE